MNEHGALAERFEMHREMLEGLAFRMLGSWSDAEDAVQEAWLRLARADASEVQNLPGWLRRVVSRICLDALPAREARREDRAGGRASGEGFDGHPSGDPEQEAMRIDGVGRALLVVLERLEPAERVAFVLHDLFAVPFEEIAPLVERSLVAAKKLASRARHKVRGAPSVDGEKVARHRRVVEAFMAASRAGDIDAVMAVLAPDVVRSADAAALAPGRATEVRGARAVAEEIVVFRASSRFAALALVDGDVGVVVAPRGRLVLAVLFTIDDDKVAGYELVADPARLRLLDLAVLG